MVADQLGAAPAEIDRWRRQAAAGLSADAAADSRGMESVLRVLCHVDETWFRLHYFACTDAPAALASSCGGAGVPGFGEWMQRAVGATMSSAWLGGAAQSAQLLEAQAASLEGSDAAPTAVSQGGSVDLDGAAAAAVLRRGSAAALLGSAALSQPPRKLGRSAAKGGSAGGRGNELLKIYDCMTVESQLLFWHCVELKALGERQWQALAGSSPGGGSQSDSGACVACAAPLLKAGKKRKKSQNAAATRVACRCFCGGAACAEACLVSCVSCKEPVCLRCRQENYDLDDARNFCPRCAHPGACAVLTQRFRAPFVSPFQSSSGFVHL